MGLLVLRIMEAVIGFFSCQDEDLSDACPIDPVKESCSRKLCQSTPLGASCLEIASSDGIRLCTPIFFLSEHLVSNEHCEALLVIIIM
jgi:hypothetical protein